MYRVRAPADAPYTSAPAATMADRDFDTPALFAAAHAARLGATSAPGGSGAAGGESERFVPSFAPTGDLSAGVVRQRRELHVLPSARIVLLDGVGLSDEHADELADYMRDNSRI